MRKFIYIINIIIIISLTGCASNQKPVQVPSEWAETSLPTDISEADNNTPSDTITLLFAGDIMAHSVNYNVTTYEKIWKDVKHLTSDANLTFGNIESPIDTTLPASSYPNFNMTKKYVQASIDAGFDVFSLCNNHTNDQFLNGIKETQKTVKNLTDDNNANNHKVYFSGLKETPESSFSYNIIEKKGWKILFLPVTEILNRPDCAAYINYIKTDAVARADFISFIKQLKQNNQCDLFILSLHANEPEYTRAVTDSQEAFYKDLIAAGVDIIWANHAHIIKNRKVIVNTKTNRDQLIMYANGNTISGQRTKPELTSKNPVSERDNTGDGLLYKVTLKKNNGSMKIQKAEPIFITTYINTAYEYVLKPLNQDFVDYLNDVPRTNWAKYIERRIKINNDATKDLIEWQ